MAEHSAPATETAFYNDSQQAMAQSSPAALLASNSGLPALESLLGFETGAVSDSPFAVKWPTSLLAPALQSSGASALFVRTDTTTQGNWKGKYGADGYQIVNDAVSYPSYAQVTSSIAAYSWAPSTSEARALQKSAEGSTDRIASCWYQSPELTIDVNITDGKAHQLALYSLDWDGANGRSQRVDIINAATNTTLDTRTISAFSNGSYLVWNISGHVIIRVTQLGAGNSVVSALFFGPAGTNVALASNGGVATALSTTPASDGLGNYQPLAAINGERLAVGTGDAYSDNTFWRDGTHDAFPDWLQVDFDGTKLINEIDIYSLQDDYHNPIEPTASTTFSLYGLTAFEVQYWDGSAWATVPGGSVTGNNKVWRQFTFSPITTSKIRVLVNNALASRSRLVELEAYGQAATTGDSPTQNTSPELSMARLDPVNRTGGGGEDLLSGNYNWTLPLVSLPGRAGLDLGLSLSYNSLVWTRTGQTITYDADQGFPSPGFRLGFPTIEPLFLNSQTGRNAYLLMTPSGSRVELRKNSTQPNLYESADSSYLELDASLMILRTMDGTQLYYDFKGGAYRCTGVKDRNGNFITVTYFEQTGDIKEIIDTLGRQIKFNYVSGNLDTITEQHGSPETQTVLASFGYLPYDLNIQPNFVDENGAQLTTAGLQHSSPIPFLNMVGLPDHSYYKFTYASWGQVSRITRYGSDSDPAQDNHALSYVNYNLANDAMARIDCPRFTERRDWAENWNGNAEAVTTFSPALNNTEGTVTLPQVTYTTPSGIPSTSVVVMNKETFGTGVQKGLRKKVETFANNVLVRTNETVWAQDKQPDNSEYAYQVNPRPIETVVKDSSGNIRGTLIDYGPYASYGLPYEVSEYAGAGKTVLRRTRTHYNLSSAYTARHIIGLVSVRQLFEGTSTTDSSHVEYLYDLNLNQEYLQDQGVAIQHDRDNYPLSLIEGRGNLTRVVLWNTLDNQAPVQESRMGYNTTGSVIFARDPMGHQSLFSYADSFSTTVSLAHPTFAYPTSITDGDGKTSNAKYDYYLGAAVEVTDPKGAVVKTLYDEAGRTDKVYNTYNNAFKQFHYGANYVVTYTSLKNLTETLYSVTTLDGMGQVTGTAQQTSAPGSPDPHYNGKRYVYDLLGRVEFESNATEMAGGWAAAGDDVLQANGEGGWRYTQQTYDWKGRPLVTVNQDNSTKVMSYGGCGCAGGEVVTIQGEELGVGQRRKQMVYHDVLGRPVKTENYNWDAQTVYSTTMTEYNMRDQELSVKEYQGQAAPDGSCPTGTCQQTAMTYDGYGRLATRKLPQQAAATTYTYYTDGLMQSVTDARGATATYGYNGRHLVTAIAYRLAGSPDIDVSYGYDNAGNRSSMSDATGTSEYHYDQLSRMDWEKRTVYGIAGDNNTFKISYGYDLGGNLTSVTDHFNATVGYARDVLGRLTAVNGSGFNEVMDTPGGQEVTQYASNITYRAWGALKHLSYSQGLELDLTYDKQLQLRQYEVSPVAVVNGSEVKIKNQYDYYADGRVRFISDLYDHRFDRSYSYDHVGRLSEAHTSHAARGEQGGTLGPYQQTYQYDAFDHMTGRTSKHWSKNFSYSTTYLNNRDQKYGLAYDNEGNLLIDSSGKDHTYDAAGDAVKVFDSSGMSVVQGYDGDHRQVKRTETLSTSTTTPPPTYSLRSTVLGGVVLTELYSDGSKWKTHVYANGQRIATQGVGKELNGYGLITQSVTFHHVEPVTGNETDSWKQFGAVGEPTELDPLGVDAWTRNKYLDVEEPDRDWPRFMHGTMSQPGSGCSADGVWAPCDYVLGLLNSGNAVVCPNNDCGARTVVGENGRRHIAPLGFNPRNGRLGYSYWVNDVGTMRDDGDRGDIVVVNRNENALGHWEFAAAPDGNFYDIGLGRRVTAQNTDSKEHSDDCLSMAAIIDDIAQFDSQDDDDFIFKVNKKLVAPDAQTGGPFYRMYTSRGFKPQFREPAGVNYSANQVHHYAGTFFGGYILGRGFKATGIIPYQAALNKGIQLTNNHENNTPELSAIPDRALNQFSVRHGVGLAYGRINRFQIGGLIRDEVCGSK